jgi:hypothetical protein
MSGVEERLRRVEDRIELSDLVATYGQVVDDRDPDGMRACYAKDSVFDTVTGRIEGREAIVDYYLERLRIQGPSFHVPHSQTVEFTGPDEASGVVTAHAELGTPDGTFWVALRYHDRYIREDGRWRFRERVVKQLYAMPLRELVTDLNADKRVRWAGTEPAVADIPEGLRTWQEWLASG